MKVVFRGYIGTEKDEFEFDNVVSYNNKITELINAGIDFSASTDTYTMDDDDDEEDDECGLYNDILDNLNSIIDKLSNLIDSKIYAKHIDAKA